MLFATPTKYGAGLTIWGDYRDLKGAHAVISLLSDKVDLCEGAKEYVLALAYDLRHAYQGDRETMEVGFDDLDKATYRGVQVLWPFYLSQVAMLRQFASYVPHTAFEQACLYLLENCARMALMEYDAEVGTKCLAWLETPPPFGSDYLLRFVDYATRRYVSQGKTGKARFRKLPELLRTLHPFSQEYRIFQTHVEGLAKEQKCAPHEFGVSNDGSDFKW